jgi:hypothetical protein
MGIFLGIIFLGLSSATLIALLRRLKRQRASAGLWGALAFLILCGIGLGIWCASYCEYPVGAQLRFDGFPIPIVIFHLENGAWVDFPLNTVVALPLAFTNIITITSLTTLPLWFLSKKSRS